MSAAELVRYLTNALFLLIFVAVARTALRERNRASLNTTLLFAAIALVIVQSQVSAAFGVQNAALSVLSILLLLALPYLQLRLVEDFAGVRPIVMRACVAGLAFAALVAVAGVLRLVDLTAVAVPLIGVAVLYFLGFGTYAAVGFGREARRTGGVARTRMALAAGGSLALSLTLLVATTGQLVGPALSRRCRRKPAGRRTSTRSPSRGRRRPVDTSRTVSPGSSAGRMQSPVTRSCT